MRLRSALAILAAVSLCTAAPIAAQADGPRPRLDARADTNDWGAYFDQGVTLLRQGRTADAEQYFVWATHLDPQRAEPLFARFVAFHLSNIHRFEDYLADRPKVLADSAVQLHDALRYAAEVRNPFVHRGLELLLFEQLYAGRFGSDPYTLGFIAYAKPDFPRAIVFLGRVGRRSMSAYMAARSIRAQAFVDMSQYDSAAAEIVGLRAILERHEEGHLVRKYDSKEMLDYSLGLLYAASGHVDRARETLQQAVLENAGFYPAHLWLGDMALDADDAPGAVTEYEQALTVEPGDVVLRYHYGLALSRAGRLPAAAAELRQATSMAPAYAAPWFELARALERGGDVSAAREAYYTYVGLAPRTAAATVARARERLAALGPA